MKCIIKHERLGEITYTENAWTGKKSLYIGGQKLEQPSKSVFMTAYGERIELRGNFFRGTQLLIGSETIAVTPACKWYEYVLSAIPFVLVMIWGNAVPLCEIIPIVGGALGGAIGGLSFALCLLALRKVKNIALKILISVGITGVCFLICYLIALAILA